jgi:hypothetical protein
MKMQAVLDTHPSGDSLVIQPLHSEEDAARFIAHNHAITGEGPVCDRLIHHFPGATFDDFFIVEDSITGEVASSTCLLPWMVRFEGIELRAAMLEMVVTKPAYRRRGLVRLQIEHLKHLVASRGYDFSIIQGIPYYYRQFGYAYALDHTPLEILDSRNIPVGAVDLFEVRPATIADRTVLADLYAASMRLNEIFVDRPLEYWDYLLCDVRYPLQIVQQRHSGRIVAFFHAVDSPDTSTLQVTEIGLADPQDALGILQLLKKSAKHAANIHVGGSQTHPLVRMARSLGSSPRAGDQWLLHLHDPRALLIKLAPLLEKRLQDSPRSGLTANLTLNFYREACVLEWVAGRLERVTPAGFVDASMGAQGSDLQIPPDAFVRLLFGYRSLEELLDAWPDTRIREEIRPLWQALFPRLNAWINMTY